MAKRKKGKEKLDTQASPSFASPFAGLADLRSELPEGEKDNAAVETTAPPDAKGSPRFSAKVVLTRQRKRYGGKTVTLVQGVLLQGDQRAQFVKDMSRALGTHGRDDGEFIVLSGDQRERAEVWLKDQGAKRVVTSG